MKTLGVIIDFDDDIRRLYSSYDFKYFLYKNISSHQYDDQNQNVLRTKYTNEINRLKIELKKNKRQALLYIDGQIRKCHSGGFLPSLFNLDETRDKCDFVDFEEVGRTWALFEVWSKAEQLKIRMKDFWDITIKIGAILGFVSTVTQIVAAVS